MVRATTRRAMIDALSALDDLARLHADILKGFAAGIAVCGLKTDYVETSVGTDHGRWLIDRDGRRVWMQAS
ncbi:hypothetical protein [Hyphomicrobium sp.]|jgi:hypothetical protein|uniref:hypothetical protein n=1 Tax=Hyphomicrobium sp. TaxID=82 RepID=UPI003569A3A6